MRHLIFLNMMGDVEITWDKKNDHLMKTIIEEKMRRGVSFFSLNILGFKSTKPIDHVSELKNCKVRFDDEHLEQMWASGAIKTVRTNTPTIETQRRLTTADEVLNNPTSVAALRPLQGG